MESEEIKNKVIPPALEARYMDELMKEREEIVSLSLEKRLALINKRYEDDVATAIEMNSNGSLNKKIRDCKKPINQYWSGMVLVIFLFCVFESIGMSKEKGELKKINTTRALLCHVKASRFRPSDAIMLKVPINGTYTIIDSMVVPTGVSVREWDKYTREGLYAKKFIELGGSSQGCVVLSGTPIDVIYQKVPISFYSTKLQITSLQINKVPVPIIQETNSSNILYVFYCFFVPVWTIYCWSSRKQLKQLLFFQSLLKG